MIEPELPRNEASRVQALQDLEILDSQPEEVFDRITRLAQSIFDVPIALVSLVDSERQWFKSCQGLDAKETPRNVSFCGHAILGDEILYVSDALKDSRFADNPLVVGAPHIRFYAGAPVCSVEGYRLGTLCIISDKPTELDAEKLKNLRDLADCVEHEIARYKAMKTLLQADQPESYLRAVLSTVDDGIITIDAEGCIKTVNRAAEKIFAYDADEMIGNNVSMLMPDAYSRQHDRYIKNYLETGRANIIGVGREVVGRRKNGTVFPMDLAVTELEGLESRCFVGIVRDITVRKEAETVKQEFVSTVSHELRTPLTAIRGALGLVLDRCNEELSEKARTLLEAASRNSETLSLLINDILDLEKIETGNLDFHLKVQPLDEILQETLNENASYAERHQVRIQCEVLPKAALVNVDEHRIKQVMANLLSNAVKFSEPGGEVVLSVDVEDECYRIKVKDFGRGIPEGFRGKIFERFSQADSSDSREKGGTGLGLSICKAIIEQHKGTISFDSEENQGSCFYFELPRWKADFREKAEGNAKQKVLVCEDNKDVAMVIQALLRDEGLDSDWSGTAHCAMERLKTGDYQALLLDLNLPDKNGLVLISELQAMPDFYNLPIIVVSANANENRQQRSNDYNVVSWLDKPLDRKQLAASLHEAFGHKRQMRILHVEDDPDVIAVVQALLDSDDIAFNYATTIKTVKEKLQQENYDLIILDLDLPDGDGKALLAELSKKRAPVLVFTGSDTARDVDVSTVLTKSKTSNETLLLTVRELLKDKWRADE